VDFSGDIKQLFGQYQFALDVARGKTKVEWKASTGNVDVNAYNQIFFGGTVTTGDELLQAINEGPTAIPTTPFQITATHGANFVMDLGVYNATTGLPLKQVASAPATGQYSVSAAGVYTFAAADVATQVLLNYLWDSATTGGSLIVSNQLMGNTPKFQLVLSQLYEGKTFTLLLYSNVADKLTLPLKQDDLPDRRLVGSGVRRCAQPCCAYLDHVDFRRRCIKLRGVGFRRGRRWYLPAGAAFTLTA
jgi:hypothetical protein